MLNVFSHRTLQSLYEAASMVLDQGRSPELLRESVEELRNMVRFRESAVGQQLLDRTRTRYAENSDDIEIDDATLVYHNESDGYWVMAWCYVEDEGRDDNAPESLDADIEAPILVTDQSC